ncbi:hypothetical protein OROMI_017250 [Orobanche minor]
MATKPFSSKNPSLLPIDDAHRVTDFEASVSPQEWQGWGTISPVPSMVNRAINDLNLLQKDISACMTFDGNYGKLSGGFKLQEDRKHRAKYASLSSSEEKLQFYSARQIACRLLGSRGYLCRKLLASPGRLYVFKSYNVFPLAENAYLVVYASKEKIGCSEEGLKVDFLRQNNTGKLLWQVFGVEAASLCLFGIAEDEEIMWNELNHAGRNMVCCLYPNKNAVTESVKDSVGCVMNLESQAASCNLFERNPAVRKP